LKDVYLKAKEELKSYIERWIQFAYNRDSINEVRDKQWVKW
jgi:hypothetical protein